MVSPRPSLLCWLFLFGATCQSAVAQSYTPEHAKVRAMVDRGVAFLQSSSAQGDQGYARGEAALVAYALLKATGEPDQPRVAQGVAAAQRIARSLASFRESGESKIVYEASIAAILLANFNAAEYQPELLLIRDWLVSIQKPHGGFGYLGQKTGDTSQVQYVVLAMWTLEQVGVETPVSVVEATIDYLRSTMDPSGAWGYQGVLGNGRLVPQDKVSKSLATAGAGALIISGDILGLFGKRQTAADESEGIPAAFVRTDLRNKLREERKAVSVSRADLEGPIRQAQRYQSTSKFSGGYWYYYWRYSQERYESFQEIVDAKQEKSPAWYNNGVNELAESQEPDGSWGALIRRDILYSQEVCTSFSILFLIRSTQKAIGKLDEGIVHGGYGLPNDVTTIKLVGDRIVSDEETSVENLLAMLEEEEVAGVEVGLLPNDLQLAKDPSQRREQVARLARLLMSPDAQARRVAAKLLGRCEDLNQVPELIFALSDDDPYVPMIAEESLRLLSRQLNAGKLTVEPSASARRAAEEYWKDWYLGLRPDYIFIDRSGAP